MKCPQCGTRNARRGCPALGQRICAVCCGTKRVVQIRCPSDCPYLATAREHPPAAAVRLQQQHVHALAQSTRDLSERQLQLFFLINTFLRHYEPPELQPLLDQDVADAAAALAGTFETASRGVIYEHRPSALPADRLASALKPVIAEAGKPGGSAFDRDAAVVLRRIEEAARAITGSEPSSRAYLDLLGQILDAGTTGAAGAHDEPPPENRPRLIVP